MKKFISQIVLILILAISSFAQNESQEMILYDEQKDMPLSSILYSSMGSVAYEMSQNKEIRFQINIYGGNNPYYASPYIYRAYIFTTLKINYKVPFDRNISSKLQCSSKKFASSSL